MLPVVGQAAATAGPIALWIAALSLLGLLFKQIGPWKKQLSDVESQLREAMARRIDKLEMRLERQEEHHRVETTIGNHALRNITACFDAMLLLLEMNPDRGPEIVIKIKEMRAVQMLAEAEEKSILRTALFRSDKEEEESKVDATNMANHAVSDAKQTLRSTTNTRDELAIEVKS